MREGTSILWDELSSLAEAYAGLGKQFHQASRQLQLPGALPEPGLFQQVEELRERYQELRDRVEAAALEVGLERPLGPSTLKGLAILLEELSTAEDLAEQRKARAEAVVGVLDQILALRHHAIAEFEPLAACQALARELREAIGSGPAEHLDEVVQALEEQDHPFIYLLTMVEGADRVSDDLWESLFESVGREFGRPLAAAVARGKVGFDEAVPAKTTAIEVSSPSGPAGPPTVVVQFRSHSSTTAVSGPHAPVSERTDPAATARAFEPALAALASDDVLDPIAEEASSFLPSGIASLLAARGRGRAAKKSTPKVERLETVRLLSCNIIAGHVFLDADNDGLFDPGESPIAGSVIDLRNSQGIVVGTATSDSSGAYSFSTDNTISTAPLTLSQTVTIPNTPTNFTAPFTLAQFNPELGELIDVQIMVHGQLTSDIKAENTSTSSPETIQAHIIGQIRLTGQGFDLSASLNASVGAFQAGVYDGQTDYAGTSGFDFGDQSATLDQTFTLSQANGDDLSAFIGTGDLNGSLVAMAQSSATGGGNIDYQNETTGEAIITAVYRYTPNNCLAPGDYTLVQLNQPPGTLNGSRSSDGQIYPPPTTGPDLIPVTLTDHDSLANDFGEILPAKLAGFVYEDANDDGLKQAGEAPIAGTSLTLTGTDDLGQPVTLTATTDSTGAYLFDNLRPGLYRILESQPSGYLDGKDTVGSQGGTLGNDQIDAITLGQGVTGVNNNFGELLPARLSGFVYVDANDDGQKEAGETPIGGVTVTLTGTNDLGQPVTLSTTTDVNGAYAFNNLRPGTYQLVESQPSGFLDGKDTVGSQGGTAGNDTFSAIVLGQGVDGVNNNFGELEPASLSGFVYFDRNDDGVKEASEPGIPGTTVTLTGTNDLGQPVTLTTTTDVNGAYAFTNLRPGTYQLVESQPSGFLDGKDTVGSQGGTTGNDTFSAIVLGQGVDGVNNNFGELSGASLSGFVYVDANDDGQKEAGETPISGVTVTLTGTTDLGQSVSLTAMTDVNGAYAFMNLRPGTYRIVESQPSGYLDGKDSVGSQGGTLGNDQIDTIALLQGVNGVDNNFGELEPASLSGFVYFDRNDDGVKEASEPGIPGTTVTLTGTNDLGQPVTLTTTTDVNGAYAFTNLRPGTYQLVESQPSGFLDGKDTVGSQGGTAGNDIFSAIVLGQGVDGVNNNFGELSGASLSGFVYVDANDDGQKGAGETPISGVTVTLTGTTDLGQSVSLTAMTDVNGAYAFINLRPGTYRIVESQPSGYLDGKDSVGSQGGTLGNDQIDAITLLQGVNGVDNNFGELEPARLSGFVYFDRNDDGVKEASEPGIPGTTVTLTGTNDLGQPVTLTTTTDVNGAYAFTNLRPGTYQLVESQPSGFLDGKDTVGSQGGTTGNDTFSAIVLGQGVDGVNNNFGELTGASLSGFVYVDANDDGVKEAGETPISGVTVTLTGTTDLGQSVSLTAMTDVNGAYAFMNLRPGTYRIVESQPSGYLDGKDSVGSQGGTLGNDQIDAITLLQGVNGVDNNFGELLPGALNGFVYFDANQNGLKDPGERGIPNVPIQLTGSTSLGPITPRFATTDANGFYSFVNLRPGIYTVTETTQPSAFVDGLESKGNQVPIPNTRGGSDSINGIMVPAGGLAPNNNFGEEVVPVVACDVINQVEEVTRLGIHHQPTRLLVRFSNQVDPASATNLANYHLVQASRDGRLSSREIPIRSAVYDPTTLTVTLTVAHPINIHYPYRLSINGVLDLCGDPIDGDGDGQHGGEYVTIVTKANYPYGLSDRAIQAQKVEAWSTRFPRLAAQRRVAGPRARRS